MKQTQAVLSWFQMLLVALLAGAVLVLLALARLASGHGDKLIGGGGVNAAAYNYSLVGPRSGDTYGNFIHNLRYTDGGYADLSYNELYNHFRYYGQLPQLEIVDRPIADYSLYLGDLPVKEMDRKVNYQIVEGSWLSTRVSVTARVTLRIAARVAGTHNILFSNVEDAAAYLHIHEFSYSNGIVCAVNKNETSVYSINNQSFREHLLNRSSSHVIEFSVYIPIMFTGPTGYRAVTTSLYDTDQYKVSQSTPPMQWAELLDNSRGGRIVFVQPQCYDWMSKC